MQRLARERAADGGRPGDAAVFAVQEGAGRGISVAGALLLTALYAFHYLRYPARPGTNQVYPLGWWGWFDQSKYIQSARALARFDFLPAQHFYPLGYALLGAPFARVMPQEPFVLVDLASLLVAYAAFLAFARRCSVAPAWGVALFVLAAGADPVLFDQWVIPWNTSPLAAILWLLFATAAAHMQGRRRPASLGVLVALVPMLRPTDVLIAGVPIAGSLAADLLGRRLSWRDAGAFLLAALLPLLAYGALYLRIYGPHLTEYMRVAGAIGFTLHDFGLKAYLILVDPRAWIGGGEGLLQRCPWMVLGLAGIPVALRRPVPAMLAVALVVHEILYLSYVDLLPTGFWRYDNVHYWLFAFPGFALLGFLLLRDLYRPGNFRRAAAASLVLVVLLLCIHLVPARAGPDQSADALDIPIAPHDFNTVYQGALTVTDAVGTLQNIRQVRAFPFGEGIRILSLTRAIHGPATVRGAGIDEVAPIRLRAAVRWGVPLSPWTSTGAFYGPRE